MRRMIESRMSEEAASKAKVVATIPHVGDGALKAVLDGRIDRMRDDSILSVAVQRREERETSPEFEVVVGGADSQTYEIVPEREGELKVQLLSFFLEDKWKYVHHDFLRARRRFWKKFLYVPWNLEVH